MTNYDYKLIKKQVGASFFGTFMLVAIIGLFLTAGLKIAPSYMDHNVVLNAMDGIISNNDMTEISLADIKQQLARTLSTNGIRSLDLDDNIVLVRENGRDYIDINYESRVPLFYNIEAVVVFSERFNKF